MFTFRDHAGSAVLVHFPCCLPAAHQRHHRTGLESKQRLLLRFLVRFLHLVWVTPSGPAIQLAAAAERFREQKKLNSCYHRLGLILRFRRLLHRFGAGFNDLFLLFDFFGRAFHFSLQLLIFRCERVLVEAIQLFLGFGRLCLCLFLRHATSHALIPVLSLRLGSSRRSFLCCTQFLGRSRRGFLGRSLCLGRCRHGRICLRFLARLFNGRSLCLCCSLQLSTGRSLCLCCSLQRFICFSLCPY